MVGGENCSGQTRWMSDALGCPWAQVAVAHTWQGVREVYGGQCPAACRAPCPLAVLLGKSQLVLWFRKAEGT